MRGLIRTGGGGQSPTVTNSDGEPVVNTVVSDRPIQGEDKVIYYTITLDGSTSDTYVIPDTEGYSTMWMAVSVAGGTQASTYSAKFDLSSDQSGVYTPAVGLYTAADLTAVDATIGNGAAGFAHNIAASAIQILVGATEAANTGTVTVVLKGAS